MRPTAPTAAALALLAAGTAAAAEGDPARGAQLAAERCAACHDISPDGPMKLHPPAFAAIAVYRPEAEIARRLLFPAQHSGMPQMSQSLDPQQVADLTAFILSLE